MDFTVVYTIVHKLRDRTKGLGQSVLPKDIVAEKKPAP